MPLPTHVSCPHVPRPCEQRSPPGAPWAGRPADQRGVSGRVHSRGGSGGCSASYLRSGPHTDADTPATQRGTRAVGQQRAWGPVTSLTAVLRRGACAQATRGRAAHRVGVDARGCSRTRSHCEGGMVPPSRPRAQNGHRSAPADTNSNVAWCATVAGSVTGVGGLTYDAQSMQRGT
jgi:hypothetical protein